MPAMCLSGDGAVIFMLIFVLGESHPVAMPTILNAQLTIIIMHTSHRMHMVTCHMMDQHNLFLYSWSKPSINFIYQ
jgi:hypothetical protein